MDHIDQSILSPNDFGAEGNARRGFMALAMAGTMTWSLDADASVASNAPTPQILRNASRAFLTSRQRKGLERFRGPNHARVGRIGRRLAAHVPPPLSPLTQRLAGGSFWLFHAYIGPKPVAFALPSFDVGISQGALDLCENDGQIAAILSQRMARLTLARADLASQQILIDEASFALAAPRTAQETEALTMAADLLAIGHLARAGYDPRDCLAIWQHIGVTSDGGFSNYSTRLTSMRGALHAMGYQT